MRTLIPTFALLLAACEPSAEEAATLEDVATDLEERTEALAVETEAVATLAGSWRVAELDGEPFENFVTLELYANSRLLYWEPTCAGLERRYAIEGREFSAMQTPSDGPRIVCDIGLPERIEDVFAAIDEADRIQPADGGGVMLSGLRRSVLLMPL